MRWLQFYLTEADIGLPRARSSLSKLAELNEHVPVNVFEVICLLFVGCIFHQPPQPSPGRPRGSWSLFGSISNDSIGQPVERGDGLCGSVLSWAPQAIHWHWWALLRWIVESCRHFHHKQALMEWVASFLTTLAATLWSTTPMERILCQGLLWPCHRCGKVLMVVDSIMYWLSGWFTHDNTHHQTTERRSHYYPGRGETWHAGVCVWLVCPLRYHILRELKVTAFHIDRRLGPRWHSLVLEDWRDWTILPLLSLSKRNQQSRSPSLHLLTWPVRSLACVASVVVLSFAICHDLRDVVVMLLLRHLYNWGLLYTSEAT